VILGKLKMRVKPSDLPNQVGAGHEGGSPKVVKGFGKILGGFSLNSQGLPILFAAYVESSSICA
jgi:hypothetical protein